MAFDPTQLDFSKTEDMTQAKTGGGGGGYTPPAEGLALLRFVGYYEVGKHVDEWKGHKKTKDKVWLVFELSGKNHPPREMDDGTKIPTRMTVKMNYSLHEKSKFFPMFKAMNEGHEVKHIAQLLGEAFRGKVEHTKKTYNGQEFTFANLVDIQKPTTVDVETGEEKSIKVAPPLSDIKAFIWSMATPEMWDSIYIDGEYPEVTNDKGEVLKPAKSKNVIQEAIMEAVNWHTCPVHDYAMGNVSQEDSEALDEAVEQSDAQEESTQEEPQDEGMVETGAFGEDEEDLLEDF